MCFDQSSTLPLYIVPLTHGTTNVTWAWIFGETWPGAEHEQHNANFVVACAIVWSPSNHFSAFDG